MPQAPLGETYCEWRSSHPGCRSENDYPKEQACDVPTLINPLPATTNSPLSTEDWCTGTGSVKNTDVSKSNTLTRRSTAMRIGLDSWTDPLASRLAKFDATSALSSWPECGSGSAIRPGTAPADAGAAEPGLDGVAEQNEPRDRKASRPWTRTRDSCGQVMTVGSVMPVRFLTSHSRSASSMRSRSASWVSVPCSASSRT